MSAPSSVATHYSAEALSARLIGVLERAGKSRDSLTVDDLHEVDQLHLRGQIAAEEFLGLLHIHPGDRVLDVGSGLGGPARMAASRYGASVTGIDLTEAFCACARDLNAAVGLDRAIRIHQGDALAMPFADDSFDVVFTQHVAMNIHDKAALYREIARVLKPGGRFGLYDVVEGDGEPLHLPVPWASLPEHNHLVPADTIAAQVAAAGFRTELFEDKSAVVEAYMDEQRAARQARAKRGEDEPPSGAPIIMGDNAAEKQKNIYRNLKEGRIAVRLGIFRLPEG